MLQNMNKDKQKSTILAKKTGRKKEQTTITS